MNTKLSEQELLFIAFLYRIKKELTMRKVQAKKKKLQLFTGTAKERKALKRSTPVALWIDVEKHLKNKISNLFSNGSPIASQIGNWKRIGPPSMVLRNFQEAKLLNKLK